MSTQALQTVQGTQKVHDARDGFHDIKPGISSSASPLWWFLLAILILLLFWLLLFFRKYLFGSGAKKERRRKPKAVSSYIQELNLLAADLEVAKISLKDAAEKTALLIRGYIYDHRLVSIADNTPKEAKERLLAQASTASISSEVEKLLTALERVAFAADKDNSPISKVVEQVKRTAGFIEHDSASLKNVSNGEEAQ